MSEVIIKLQISAAVVLVAISFSCLLLRRSAFWTLLGLSLGIKGVVLASLALLQLLPAASGRALVLLMLVSLAFLMLGGFISLAVMTRAQRFSGELDWDKEARMRH